MDEADSGPSLINEVNSAAIRDVDPETNIRLVCDQPVTPGKAFAALQWSIDNPDAVSMHLFRRHERTFPYRVGGAHLSMNFVQPSQRFGFISLHVDAGHTCGESMPNFPERAQRRELLRG